MKDFDLDMTLGPDKNVIHGNFWVTQKFINHKYCFYISIKKRDFVRLLSSHYNILPWPTLLLFNINLPTTFESSDLAK